MEHQPHQRSAKPAPAGLAVASRSGKPDWEEDADALVGQIREGNEAAFEALFQTYYEALSDFVRRKVDRPEVAEGLVQNVFFNLWRRRQAWQPRQSVKAYLYGAARNEAAKYLRRRGIERSWQQRERHLAPQPEPTPMEQCHSRELSRTVRRWVEELPERRRLVFVLVRYHGLSHAEAAAAMGISTKTVEVQMWKALTFLRERLSARLSEEV